MNCKRNAKGNSGDEKRLFNPEVEKVVEIGLERLMPFENHPFKVKEYEAMALMTTKPEEVEERKKLEAERKYRKPMIKKMMLRKAVILQLLPV